MDILKKLNYIFNKSQKTKFFVLFVIMFVGALFESIGVSLILPFVSVITEPTIIQKNYILRFIYNFLKLQSTNEFLVMLSIVMILVYIIKNLYLLFMYSCQYTFTYNNQMSMSVRLMECYLKKPYTFHLQKNTAEIIRCLTSDVTNLFALVLSFLLLISEILVALMLLLLLIMTDIFITTMVSVLLALTMMIFYKVFKSRIKVYGQKSQKHQGLMIKWINQALGGIKEIKVLRRERFFIDSYSDNGNKFVNAAKRNSLVGQVPRLLIETVCVVGILSIVCAMIFIGKDIKSLVPTIATFAMVAFRLLPSVSRMNSYLTGIMFTKPSIDLIYDDLIETGDIVNEKQILKTVIEHTKILNSIKIQNLSFKYPNTDKFVLQNVNFEIPIGKSTAFIGTSGSGKTTMADIILGLLKPEEGIIFADNLNIHENLDIWSEKVGYIPQAIYLSDDTIRNNVAFGVEYKVIEDSEVWNALEQSQLKEFVENLPDKIDTIIGERGVRLSGGQRQRIGIARALYHNPEVLVLDEATSALDNETEQAVMDAIENLQGKMTLIIIAHRLTTIKNCDVKYEVLNGNVKII